MGITDDLLDTAFTAGQLKDSKNLGDPGKDVDGNFVPDWLPAFLQGNIHGVILISGDCAATITETRTTIEHIFSVGTPNATLHEVTTLIGKVRPGPEDGHEQYVSFTLRYIRK